MISYVEIRAFAHATEDVDKVVQAVKNLLPQQASEELVFKKTSLKGHHGNPIVLVETKIQGKTMIKAFVERLSSGLSTLDREFLSRNFEQHVRKGSLYLRFDKQSAFMGELRFGSADPLHLRVGFKTGKKEEMMKILRELGVLS